MLRMLSETYATLNMSIIRLCKDPQSSWSTLYQDRKDAEDGVWNIYTTLILNIFKSCKDPQSSFNTLYEDLKDAEDGVWNIYSSEPEHFKVMQGSSVILEYVLSGS